MRGAREQHLDVGWQRMDSAPNAIESDGGRPGRNAVRQPARAGRLCQRRGPRVGLGRFRLGPLAPPRRPSLPIPGSGAPNLTFLARYDEGRDLLAFVLSSTTWLWDGSSWKVVPGGIDSGEARADAHLVYDKAHQQLVYIGSRATWTWNGSRWQRHAQPEISAGTTGYDETSARVMLVQQESSACDRTACHTTTWAWDSTAWAQVPVPKGPVLPLTRSGAFGVPMAFDEARGVMVLFASAA